MGRSRSTMERKRNAKRKTAESSTTISKGRCPVCSEIARAKIFICANGHSICEACSTRVTLCPTCQSPGLKTRNLLAESLLDDMKFNCKWSGQGCDKTMKRSRLAAHEDKCDQNPEMIRFCSKFPEARNCPFKFTSKWLSEPRNCSAFKTHVQTCLDVVNFKELQYGQPFLYYMFFKDIELKKYNRTRLLHHSFIPIFFRLPSSVNRGKELVLAVFIFLKVDPLENQFLSFAFVQLTQEMIKVNATIEIPGKPSEDMVSAFGEDSLPTQKWSQKPLTFAKFLEMVKKSSNPAEERTKTLPFFLPVSFLKQYYSVGENNETFFVQVTVEEEEQPNSG